MQDAHDTFCNAVYAVEEEVQGFYDALLNHAQNMAVFPNKFTICEHFLEGIPSDMLMALICNGRLAPKVNTVKEFVLEAKAYENSIETAAHYLKHSKKSQSGQQLSLAAAQSPAIETAMAKRTEVTGQHNVGEANDEQNKEPAEANINNAFESDRTQEHGEEYIELEMYNNKYYTHGGDRTPFMRTHKVLLNFANDQVVINGKVTPAHKLELENADDHAQCFCTVEKQYAKWP
ncbi:hypothetical protein C0989_006117 [Termitomyces sp. Mn162]|nr:hypothetical protein C0989_006117 [Termitomyces sp. Mn162]